MLKYNKHYLNKLEDIFAETEYMLRYEKGSFKAGYCVLKDKKIAIVNKYYSIEGKINCLIEILKQIIDEPSILSDKNRIFFIEITKPETV
ncbi:MAG: hypothetical protein K2Q22_01585 [Cytophagales bacterium]|nr:hypothetical protein [Cytophagales bacterium]